MAVQVSRPWITLAAAEPEPPFSGEDHRVSAHIQELLMLVGLVAVIGAAGGLCGFFLLRHR